MITQTSEILAPIPGRYICIYVSHFPLIVYQLEPPVLYTRVCYNEGNIINVFAALIDMLRTIIACQVQSQYVDRDCICTHSHTVVTHIHIVTNNVAMLLVRCFQYIYYTPIIASSNCHPCSPTSRPTPRRAHSPH